MSDIGSETETGLTKLETIHEGDEQNESQVPNIKNIKTNTNNTNNTNINQVLTTISTLKDSSEHDDSSEHSEHSDPRNGSTEDSTGYHLISSSGPSDKEYDPNVEQEKNTNTWGGSHALENTYQASHCVAFGQSCLRVFRGCQAVGMGVEALLQAKTCQRITAVGFQALRDVEDQTVGDDNSAFGYAASKSVKGARNTSCGSGSVASNQNGNDNSGLGAFVLANNTSGHENSALGSSCGKNWPGSQATLMGYKAQHTLETTTAEKQTAVEIQELLQKLADLCGVSAFGYRVCENNLSSFITAFGHMSQHNNVDGRENTSMGASSLEQNVNGNACTAHGHHCLQGAMGHENTAVGANVMSQGSLLGQQNTLAGANCAVQNKGSFNCINGAHACEQSSNVSYNSIVGCQSVPNMTAGDCNSMVGAFCGPEVTETHHMSCVGYHSGPSKDGIHSSICLGSGAQADESNQLVIGSSEHPILVCDLPVSSSNQSDRPVTYLKVKVNAEMFCIPLFLCPTPMDDAHNEINNYQNSNQPKKDDNTDNNTV